MGGEAGSGRAKLRRSSRFLVVVLSVSSVTRSYILDVVVRARREAIMASNASVQEVSKCQCVCALLLLSVIERVEVEIEVVRLTLIIFLSLQEGANLRFRS